MVGALNILKPSGMTSHDVVDQVRELTSERRVGHGGTLDPQAAGVLPVCIGRPATRLSEYLLSASKVYRVECRVGIATDTHDQFGRELDRVSGREVEMLKRQKVKEGLRSFLGDYEQVPSMASARRVAGKRLYEWQRMGKEVERPAKTVRVKAVDLWRFEPGSEAVIYFDVHCTSGTYIRTLCHDLGKRLGLLAHMGFLLRCRTGAFRLQDAVSLEQLARGGGEALSEAVQPLSFIVSHLPSVRLDQDLSRAAAAGRQPLRIKASPETNQVDRGRMVSLLDPSGGLIAVGRVETATTKALTVSLAKVVAQRKNGD